MKTETAGSGECRGLLEKGLEELDRRHSGLFRRDADFFHAIESFIDELQLWNGRVRLISGSKRDIITRHLLDSLAALPLINSLDIHDIADIGSGNGFPAIPLSLTDTSLHCTMVERGAKKAAFLRNAVSLLGLGGRVEVIEKDVGRVGKQFPLVTSRAFMPIHQALPLLRKTVARDSVIVFFAGTRSRIDGELRLLEGEDRVQFVRPRIEALEVPGLDEERHLCIFS